MSDELSTKLAFIIGHYKSGSTWLAHALALHPDVRGLHEMHIFRYLRESTDFEEVIYNLFETSSWGHKGFWSFPRNYIARSTRLIRKYLQLSKGTSTLALHQVPNRAQDLGLYSYFRLKQKLSYSANNEEFLHTLFGTLFSVTKPKKYLIEKTPTNIYEVDDIKKYFPNSKLISIHRDGRDVVVSDRYHVRRAYGSVRTVQESAERWKKAMTAEDNASNKFEIFQTSYEHMQENPHDLLRQLLLFLALDSSPQVINEMIEKSSFKFATGGRENGKTDNKNFRRKGIVGDWKNELSDEELKIIDDVAGELLVKFNYN
jgi:hypothetical protein